jgi:peptidoglycan/LPS O-acetylase OafA/YrhL
MENSSHFCNTCNNFLFYSAILATYISLTVTEGKLDNFRIPLFIILRVIRLLPQLLIFILLTFLMPLLNSGPIWKEVIDPNVNNCYKNWWLNLFLIQNLYKTEQMARIIKLLIKLRIINNFIP